jgi:hypothetical protein
VKVFYDLQIIENRLDALDLTVTIQKLDDIFFFLHSRPGTKRPEKGSDGTGSPGNTISSQSTLSGFLRICPYRSMLSC